MTESSNQHNGRLEPQPKAAPLEQATIPRPTATQSSVRQQPVQGQGETPVGLQQTLPPDARHPVQAIWERQEMADEAVQGNPAQPSLKNSQASTETVSTQRQATNQPMERERSVTHVSASPVAETSTIRQGQNPQLTTPQGEADVTRPEPERALRQSGQSLSATLNDVPAQRGHQLEAAEAHPDSTHLVENSERSTNQAKPVLEEAPKLKQDASVQPQRPHFAGSNQARHSSFSSDPRVELRSTACKPPGQ